MVRLPPYNTAKNWYPLRDTKNLLPVHWFVSTSASRATALTHCFIPASGSFEAANTFVADIKSVKILVDATPLKPIKKRKTERGASVCVTFEEIQKKGSLRNKLMVIVIPT